MYFIIRAIAWNFFPTFLQRVWMCVIRLLQAVRILKILVAVCIYFTQIELKLNLVLRCDTKSGPPSALRCQVSSRFCWYIRGENICQKTKIWKKGAVEISWKHLPYFLTKCLKPHDSNFAFGKITVTKSTQDSFPGWIKLMLDAKRVFYLRGKL